MPTRLPAWAPPLLAVQLLTRLPAPVLDRLAPDQIRVGLTRAVAWLPLVGTLIGAVTAGVYAVTSLIWPSAVAAGVALMVEALLTGAFHEDAVADFCDAFGGSASGDEARRIMRDSRIGSYGALGLILLVGTRWTATAALAPTIAVAAIVAGATAGRLLSVGLLALAPPRDGSGIAAGVGAPSRGILLGALLLTLPGTIPLLWVRPITLVGSMVAALVLLGWLVRLVRRRIGGSTGDCLGMAAYGGQIVVLLAAATT